MCRSIIIRILLRYYTTKFIYNTFNHNTTNMDYEYEFASKLDKRDSDCSIRYTYQLDYTQELVKNLDTSDGRHPFLSSFILKYTVFTLLLSTIAVSTAVSVIKLVVNMVINLLAKLPEA